MDRFLILLTFTILLLMVWGITKVVLKFFEIKNMRIQIIMTLIIGVVFGIISFLMFNYILFIFVFPLSFYLSSF